MKFLLVSEVSTKLNQNLLTFFYLVIEDKLFRDKFLQDQIIQKTEFDQETRLICVSEADLNLKLQRNALSDERLLCIDSKR